MKRTLIALTAIIALTGCTRSQLNAWVAWYNDDPDAATEFSQRPEVQEQLLGARTGHNSRNG